VTSAAQVPAYPCLAVTAAFVDIDHDGDLDAFVAGLADTATTAAGAPGLLLQNDGDGTFSDVTAQARLAAAGRALAVIPTDFDNRRDVDLFVLREDAPCSSRTCVTGASATWPGSWDWCGGTVPERSRGRREQGRLHGFLPRRAAGGMAGPE